VTHLMRYAQSCHKRNDFAVIRLHPSDEAIVIITHVLYLTPIVTESASLFYLHAMA